MNTEQEKIDEHPDPVVLQPSKYVLQAESVVAVVLSVHDIGLHIDLDQMQPFEESVAAALIQANFGYEEQDPFVIHPNPLVVQFGKMLLQALSVVSVNGRNAQV